MKPLFIKTESRATIEIECNSHGVIFIRHSKFRPKSWAELYENRYAKFDGDVPKSGGYVVIGGREFQICDKELEAIKAAVKNRAGDAPPLTEISIPEDERHATNEMVSLVLAIQKYLTTYGKMIEDMSLRHRELLSPVQRETCPIIVTQILDLEARLELLRRNLERYRRNCYDELELGNNFLRFSKTEASREAFAGN